MILENRSCAIYTLPLAFSSILFLSPVAAEELAKEHYTLLSSEGHMLDSAEGNSWDNFSIGYCKGYLCNCSLFKLAATHINWSLNINHNLLAIMFSILFIIIGILLFLFAFFKYLDIIISIVL
jgi:hypothetical protein